MHWRQDNPYIDLLGQDRGLGGLWMLDEPGGTLAWKAAGPLNNATHSATGITYRVPGPSVTIPYGIATLAASSGHVQLPSLSTVLGTTQPQSWELWVLRVATTDSTTPQRSVIGSDDAEDAPMLWGTSSAAIANEVVLSKNDTLVAGTEDITAWTGFSFPAGWHHHLLTCDGTQDGWLYYLDGILTGTKASSSGGAPGMPTATTYYLSQHAGGFTGLTLAACAVYNRKLDSLDARLHYEVGIGRSARPRIRLQARR